MTKRSKLILVTLVAFLGGGVVGGLAGAHLATDFTSRYFYDGGMLVKSVDAQTNVGILKNLREGNTKKAVEFLETTLDDKIVGLHMADENTQRTNEAVAKAIQMAREYRTEYPRQTQNPEVDKMVSKTLDQNAR